MLNTFNARLEIYIPATYKNTITEGHIEIPDEFVCSKINMEFNLSARTSGALSTPFPEKLSRPAGDRAEGVIGEAPDRTINLQTKYGEPIRIRWIE
jgi:hypothetical protein